MDRRYRAAAMWVAENWQAVVRNTDNASDPIQLQKDHAAATESAVLGDKALDTPEPTVNLQAVAQQALEGNKRKAVEFATNPITPEESYASAPERGIRREVSRPHYAAIGRGGTAVRRNTATRPNAVVGAARGSCSSSARARQLQANDWVLLKW
ncbi:hypothetical protein [Burkholderia vietnamiensis]|uniref:hypothetical protein n=1 Tax=Burkholderia vietnamiensis TaxID=60552 RepID=UPI0012D8902B|nr:hypothetical protein [Burkholderia vietnamiensis]